MPELPEVETVKNELLPHVVGRHITGISLIWEGIVKEPLVEEFCSRITGQEITGITRRGKYLFVSLSSCDLLIIHLKMTGSLLIGQDSSEPPKYTRAIIHLDKDTNVFFRDPRKFGLMRLVKDKNSIVSKLGPEPLEAEFTPQVLAQRLAKRTAPIKALLLEQGFIAGIGNMYADEALFAAKIHPLRSGESLSQEEIKRLHSAIQRILWAAIGNKGASVDTYFRPDGTEGTAHFEFKVAHGLGGKICSNCGGPIERIVVRNRGTYFCPNCQPE
ncbi:bifunctional DNA-formamidopyrimidine glycosylase/DNA-(apurinic or apyrimidinic site) lyase [Chloroflexota bacterium]